MDNDQINYIMHRLQRYEASISETEEHFDALESFGSYRACAPCCEKIGIPVLIDMLKADTDICDRLWQEYDRITGKFIAFDALKGSIYRDLLYADLKNYVAAYHSALCYTDLNMISAESDHDLFNREAIRALIAELSTDYDIAEIENLVTTLDDLFLRMGQPVEGTSSKKSPNISNSGNMTLTGWGEQFFSDGKNGQMRNV